MERARHATDPRAVGTSEGAEGSAPGLPPQPPPAANGYGIPPDTDAAMAGSAVPDQAPRDGPSDTGAPSDVPPQSPAQNPALRAEPGVGGALLYYAVWLPAPSGLPAGPPIYLPAGGMPLAGGGPSPAGAAAMAGNLAGMSGGGAGGGAAGGAGVASGPMPNEAQAHNQRLLVWAIILGVMAVHLPWIAYLVAVHGCWGTFIDACWQASVADGMLDDEVDPFAETLGDPFVFARIVFLMLRVQAVLSADWGEYSQAMQLSTGLGSFVLTRIVAANGLVMQGRGKAVYLAALCLTLFVILFWAELHLTSDQGHPLLGDDTVLDYISQTLPPDFASYGSVRDGLMQLLQFLRLADALILGACLALPTSQRKTA